MADYTADIAPFINTTFYVTSVFGVQPSRTHRGLDIATPSPGSDLYSISDGVVVTNTWNEGGYGWYIIIKSSNGMGFLYAHMREQSPLTVGSNVQVGQYIGHEGTTGNSTGIHLHLEMQDISNNSWIFNAPIDTYKNPADFMGFPNQEDISVYYDGIPIPPEPPKINKRPFKWVLYAKKLRNKRRLVDNS